MTTAAEGSSNPSRGLLHNLAMWWGHYAGRWLPAIYAALITLNIIDWWDGGRDASWENLARIPLDIALASGIFCEIIHHRNLCLRDIQDAPLLDPQEAVRKQLKYLKLVHRPRLAWALIAVAVLALLLPATGSVAPSLPLLAKLAVTAMAVAGVFAAGVTLHATRIHRKLQPWCPYCDHRRGGDDDPVVAPEPDPVGTANR